MAKKNRALARRRSKAAAKMQAEHMRLRLSEFHRFVRETAELWGDAFTLTMLANAIADMGYPSEVVHRMASRVREGM